MNQMCVIMPTRQELTDELRRIEGSYERDITRKKQKRAQEIIAILRKALCRTCGVEYDFTKARGEYKGFCSAKCQHAKARELGYRKGGTRSEYQVLKAAHCIGNNFVTK